MRPVREAAVAVDIDRLAAQVRQLATGQHLRVIPATPLATGACCHLVLLDNEDLSAADFCELAASAGARLLYVEAQRFDAGTDPDLSLWARARDAQRAAASDLLAELYREAQCFNGRIRQLELVFVMEGVLHCWAVAAEWYNSLVDRAAELLPLLREES